MIGLYSTDFFVIHMHYTQICREYINNDYRTHYYSCIFPFRTSGYLDSSNTCRRCVTQTKYSLQRRGSGSERRMENVLHSDTSSATTKHIAASVEAPNCPVHSVVVYTDRAEVCRTVKADLQRGENEVTVRRLPPAIDQDSIR